MKSEEASALLAAFRQLAANDSADTYDDLDPEVKSWDGKHYFVVFTLKGRSVALEPDDARDFADSLWTAAHEADEKQHDTTTASVT
jgi:hypothetical protein